ncbi:hypothetical protein D9758_013363 [Tetrapyrgos nigripes]|uniref:Uncharacterized protein n=1 Tax=Tetrapyrgos nigripes TaxID=182062 RepID=A0A8H5CJD2_9AGAR|nr:hypothetical protein D9758_013363 [Tetrapyrgos nigripes]
MVSNRYRTGKFYMPFLPATISIMPPQRTETSIRAANDPSSSPAVAPKPKKKRNTNTSDGAGALNQDLQAAAPRCKPQKKTSTKTTTSENGKQKETVEPATKVAGTTSSTRQPMENSAQANTTPTVSDIDENSAEYWKRKFLETEARRVQATPADQSAGTPTAAVTPPAIPTLGQKKHTIEVILKPRGEAGNAKTGYNLQKAIKLEDDVEYNAFLAFVRNNAPRAGIDLNKNFSKQDKKALYDLGCLTAKDLPYFTKRRFPGYWPVDQALKQFLKNRNKRINKVKRANQRKQVSGDEDDEEESGASGINEDEQDEENDEEASAEEPGSGEEDD